jgi:hypothetical protein
MDLSRLLTGMLNRLFRQVLNKGIKTGINHMAAKGKEPAEMTPAERAQAQKANELAKRARQMAKLTRRMR